MPGSGGAPLRQQPTQRHRCDVQHPSPKSPPPPPPPPPHTPRPPPPPHPPPRPPPGGGGRLTGSLFPASASALLVPLLARASLYSATSKGGGWGGGQRRRGRGSIANETGCGLPHPRTPTFTGSRQQSHTGKNTTTLTSSGQQQQRELCANEAAQVRHRQVANQLARLHVRHANMRGWGQGAARCWAARAAGGLTSAAAHCCHTACTLCPACTLRG